MVVFIRSLDSAPKDAKCDVTSPNGGPKIAHTEEMKKKFTPSEEFGDRRKHVSSARTYFYQVMFQNLKSEGDWKINFD